MERVSRKPRADAVRSARTIVEAARDVLAEDPAAELRLIVERSGLNRSTVYRHFPTRQLLVDAVYAAYVEELTLVIEGVDAAAPDVVEELRRMTRDAYAVACRWRPFRYAASFPDSVQGPRERMAAALQPVMARGRAEGVLRADLDVHELSIAWGVPLPFAATRITEGSWTSREAVAFTLRLIAHPA